MTPGTADSPEHGELRAWKIADAAASGWLAGGGRDDTGIPLGVVAALSLIAARQPEPDLASQLAAFSPDELASFLVRVWRLFAITRPELSIRTGPLARWLDEENTQTRRAAAFSTAVAVLATGELFAAAGPAMISNADLLGCTYQVLANPRGTKARGEVYTSTDVASLLMRIRLAGARPGQGIHDECAGTGALLRAAAQILRRNDVDPRTMHWYATDIDPIAIACLSVNAHLWDLGPHVTVTCANIFTEPDWRSRARHEQAQAFRDHDLRLSLARLLATTDHLSDPRPRDRK